MVASPVQCPLEQGLGIGRALIRTGSKVYSRAVKGATVSTEAPGTRAT